MKEHDEAIKKDFTHLTYLLFGLVISVIGFCLMFYVDWRIAVGVFLFTWGNNIK